MNRENINIMPGSKVAVVGLGVSGKAAFKFAQKQGAKLYVSDLRKEEQFVKEEPWVVNSPEILWEAGAHTLEFLSQADVIIISPGVKLSSQLVGSLAEKKVPIVGELAFAESYINKPVIAVTGTNGKTTVTTLIGELLKTSGKRVFVGGNIGTSLFDYMSDPTDIDAVVLEVSSFQLESAGEFAPDVAILLNISPDHLDRHGTLEEYRDAKMKLFSHMDKEGVIVVNGNDPNCRPLPENINAAVKFFGAGEAFSATTLEDSVEIVFDNVHETYGLEKTLLHNSIGLANSAPSILAARLLGCTQDQIQKGLGLFSPLEHRMEFVDEVKGVKYYNDSKATNTGAVVAALHQLHGDIVLIAGGRDKGDDYSLLKESVIEKVEKVIVIGEASGLIASALNGVVDISHAVSMKEAVQFARDFAMSGSSVLLSPACASFDMFESYGHRGRVFKQAVENLKV